MVCSYCGQNNYDYAGICVRCGSALYNYAETPQVYYDQNGYPYYYDETGMPRYYDTAPQYAVQQHYHRPPRGRVNVAVNVPKKHTGMKAFIITLVLLAVLMLGGAFAVKYLVKGPAESLEGFMSAIERMDIREAISYLEKKDREIMEAELGMMGVVGDVLSDMVGIGLPFSDILDSAIDLAPLMGDEMPDIDLEILDVQYFYDDSGNDPAGDFLGFFELNKLWCKSAGVHVIIHSEGSSFETAVLMVREGFGQWKISSESSGGGDIFGIGDWINEH